MRKLVFGILLVIITKTTYASTILLETFTQEDSVYASGGWVLRSDDSYLGIKFSVDNTIYIENIVANLGGVGDFFTGIVQISDASSVPDISPGFNPDSILFYNTNSFSGTLSTDISTTANILLTQGDYAVVFGGLGLFGLNDYGWMPGTSVLEKSSIPLTDYIEYRSENNGWVEFDYSGIRVVLEGELNPVPLPAGLYLFLSGFSVIFLSLRKQISNKSLNQIGA
jgi:hypothetical protein